MHRHITPHHIFTSHWQFVRSYTPRRTALGVLLLIVALAVTAMTLWLIVSDPDTARLGLVVVGVLALWMMAKGARA
jgi:hypothetical protein